MKKLIPTLLIPLAFIAATATPANAAVFLQVRVMDSGQKTVPVSAQAQNTNQGTSTIVISTTTPAVCTVPANSTQVPAFGKTAAFPITLTGKGTCTIRAVSGADVVERSYLIR